MTTLQIGISIGGVAILFLFALVLLRRTQQGTQGISGVRQRNTDGTFPHTCSVCSDETLVSTSELVAVSSAEKALIARARFDAVGKNLMEFNCQSCDASHYFIVTGKQAQYLGANLYQGQHYSPQCKECLKKVVPPPWEAGYYDGRVEAAPGARNGLGLECRFCGAVCCVDCCENVTRKRTSDGTLLCPRCFRGPMDTFFHP